LLRQQRGDTILQLTQGAAWDNSATYLKHQLAGHIQELPATSQDRTAGMKPIRSPGGLDGPRQTFTLQQTCTRACGGALACLPVFRHTFLVCWVSNMTSSMMQWARPLI
jgi:hypothetical protein